MIYSDYITQLRNQVGDTRRRMHVNWTADGTTTVFQMPTDTYPVLDQTVTYDVKFGGVSKTESTDYTLDKEAGTLVTTSAQLNGVIISIDSSAVYITDSGWLQIINNVIKSLGDDFWKEFVDTGLLTTANMLSLSLVTSNPECIAVYDFWWRISTTEDWVTVENFTNWRYDRENNILYLGDRDTFTVANQLLKIRGLKTYILGTAITDTIDVQDRFMTIIEYGAIARFWRYRYKYVVELVSKMTMESSRTPLQELIMMSDRFDRLYSIEKAKLKPAKPPRIIPAFKSGGGRP